ncbi:MAG: UbiX family flavin prenyltransferase [Bacillota bacterium]|jgi:4-hydroxy-3-polyprenylbenzoate decarboxylase
MKRSIVVGISGASGIIYGIRLLETLKSLEVETYLIMSEWAEKNLSLETDYSLTWVESLATQRFDNNDLTAPIASGSFLTEGMVIAPCSMKTLAGVANGYSANLLERTADVTIKEGRKLILIPRESPLSAIHLGNMLKLAQIGIIIAPPMPAFYCKPNSILELVDQQVGRITDLLGLENRHVERWGQR